MSKVNYAIIAEKLDLTVANTGEIKVDVAVIKEHLKNLNSKVAMNCVMIENNKKKIIDNRGSITFARGCIYALTILTVIVGLCVAIANYV